ncbi:MAG: hypothetical protein ACYC9S_05605 [Leptospirales bacterium]
MNFSDQTLEYLSRVRQEISRHERSILRLKQMESSLESILQEAPEPLPPSSPSPFPSLAPDRKDSRDPLPPPAPLSSFLTPTSRAPDSSESIGEMAIRILGSENRPFDLNEITERIRSEGVLPPSRDLKNAVRVALVRRKDHVLHEGRGLYRLAGFTAS